MTDRVAFSRIFRQRSRKQAKRWSDRLSACVAIGLALLCLTKVEAPRMARLDILSETLWAGCRYQAMNRIASLLK